MNLLGDYLRKRRGDLSLREFAAICNISHTHLDSIEKGKDPRTGKRVSITTDTLSSIAKGLHVDYSYLACLADNVDPRDVQNVPIPDDVPLTQAQKKSAPAEDGRDAALEKFHELLEEAVSGKHTAYLLGADGKGEIIPVTDEERVMIKAMLEAYRAQNPKDRP